jgi:hypothetical protein
MSRGYQLTARAGDGPLFAYNEGTADQVARGSGKKR